MIAHLSINVLNLGGYAVGYEGGCCDVRGCYVCGGLVPAPHSVEGGVVEDGGEG